MARYQVTFDGPQGRRELKLRVADEDALFDRVEEEIGPGERLVDLTHLIIEGQERKDLLRRAQESASNQGCGRCAEIVSAYLLTGGEDMLDLLYDHLHPEEGEHVDERGVLQGLLW